MGLKSFVKRAGTAVATGGLSEGARALGIDDDIVDAGTRIGEATGILPPKDLVDEQGIYAPTEGRVSELYGKALGQADAATTWQGPAPIREPERIFGQQVTANGVTGERVTAPTEGQAVTAGPVERFDAALAAAPKDVEVGPLDPSVQAATIGEAERASAGPVGRARLGGEATELRGAQLEAAGRIAGGPSAAARQFDAALAGITRQQLGIAASARGAERGGARREAMLAIGQQGIEAADKSAALAAQEEQAKRVAASQALGGIRSSDVEVATTSARLAQEANNLDGQIQAELAKGNAAQANALKQRQAELRQQAATSTATNAIDAARLRADVASGNVGRSVEVDLANTGRVTDASAAGATAANTRADLEAGRATDVGQKNLDRGVEVATGNADRTLTADTTTATEQNKATTRTAELAQDAATKNAGNVLERDVAQGTQTIAAQNTRQSGTASAMGAANTATATGADAAGGKVDAATGQQTRRDESGNKLVKTITSIGSALSDKRAKADVAQVSTDEIKDLADDINAVTFKYKKGVEDGGARRHAGVMAQDLERSKIGKTLVTEDSQGLKHVDYQGLAALMAAAAAKSLRGRKR